MINDYGFMYVESPIGFTKTDNQIVYALKVNYSA